MKFQNKINQLQIYCFLLSLLVSVLFQIDQNKAYSGSDLNNSLFKAVSNNNLPLVRSAITAGASAKALNQEGITAAELAIERGYYEIAHYILAIANQKLNTDKKSDTKKMRQDKKLMELNNPTSDSLGSPETKYSRGETSKINDATRPVQTHLQWPKNKPDPFSPNSNPEAIPIIGKLNKSSVKPLILGKKIISVNGNRTPKTFPLRTQNSFQPREVKEPTPLKPINEVLNNKDTIKKDGFFTGLGNLLTPNKNHKPSIRQSSKVTAEKVESDNNKPAGLINNIWQTLIDIF